MPVHVRASQTSSEPHAFKAALYSFQLVVRYFGLDGALMSAVYLRFSSAADGNLCNKATQHSNEGRQ